VKQTATFGLLLCGVLAAGGDFVPVPGGWVDEAAGVVYLPGETGRLQACRVRNGRLLWETKTRLKPLAGRDAQLLAYDVEASDRALHLAILDAKTGRVLARTGALPLPADSGLPASQSPAEYAAGGQYQVSQYSGLGFAASAAADGFQLHWWANPPASGAAPSAELPAQEEEWRRTHRGVFRLRLVGDRLSVAAVAFVDVVQAGRAEAAGRSFRVDTAGGPGLTAGWQSRKIVAADPVSGQVAWQRAIEPHFHTPPPPALRRSSK
jgi:hypothetical protein